MFDGVGLKGTVHILLTITILTVLIAFAFGEEWARGFVQGLFALALLAVGLLLWDFYREIPEKKADRYQLLELEYMPKQRQVSPTLGWTFK